MMNKYMSFAMTEEEYEKINKFLRRRSIIHTPAANKFILNAVLDAIDKNNALHVTTEGEIHQSLYDKYRVIKKNA